MYRISSTNVILLSGTVKIYDIHGKLITHFLLLEFQSNVSILDCHFWGNGVAVMSSDNIIFVAEVNYEPIIFSAGKRGFLVEAPVNDLEKVIAELDFADILA